MNLSSVYNIETDTAMMRLALSCAYNAEKNDEVPVGAVLVNEHHHIIARAGNSCIRNNDPCSHAEIEVLRKAGQIFQNYRLPQTTLYVTLEPCLMCAGALIHARVKRIVFAAKDSKTGALQSVYTIGKDKRLNHQLIVENGILAHESSLLLKRFFRKKR